jgi:hypothetical protein
MSMLDPFTAVLECPTCGGIDFRKEIVRQEQNMLHDRIGLFMCGEAVPDHQNIIDEPPLSHCTAKTSTDIALPNSGCHSAFSGITDP